MTVGIAACIYVTNYEIAHRFESSFQKKRYDTDTTDLPTKLTCRDLACPKIYDPECARPKDHDEADLCIQREMRDAAKDAVFWAFAQNFIGTASLFGVILSLIFAGWASITANRPAEAASRANNITKDLEGALLVPNMRILEDKSGDFSLVLKVNNIGNTAGVIKYIDIYTREIHDKDWNSNYVVPIQLTLGPSRFNDCVVKPGESGVVFRFRWGNQKNIVVGGAIYVNAFSEHKLMSVAFRFMNGMPYAIKNADFSLWEEKLADMRNNDSKTQNI